MPRPGALRHRVRLTRPVRTPDGQGGHATVPGTPDGWPETVAADVHALSGRERLRQGRSQATASHRVVVRYRGEVSTDTSVEVVSGPTCVGETLGVTFAGAIDGRPEWLEILADEVS